MSRPAINGYVTMPPFPRTSLEQIKIMEMISMNQFKNHKVDTLGRIVLNKELWALGLKSGETNVSLTAVLSQKRLGRNSIGLMAASLKCTKQIQQ